MIPIHEQGMRVALVERVDKPGLLGVSVRGGRFVCPLPEGYDGQTSCTMQDGYVLVAHPVLPPLRCDPTTGKVQLIEAGHVQAKAGRIRVLH